LTRPKNLDGNIKPEDSKSLSTLREEIRELTKSILALSEARQTVSLEIAEIKKESGLSIENTQVERELLSSMSEYSNRIGLDAELGRKIVSSLIESSKIAQREIFHRKEIKSFLDSQKIRQVSIVGAGRMGSWFAQYFKHLDMPVLMYDENRSRAKKKTKEFHAEYASKLDDLVSSDLIVIAVPIAKTPGLIRELVEPLQTSGSKVSKIVEVSSVKSEMARAGFIDGAPTKETLGCNVKLFSIHPLFGASADRFDKNAIVQVFPNDSTLIRGIFPHYNIVTLDWRAHDKLMGLFLTIPHALALVFADLVNTKSRVKGFNRGVITPSYEHMLRLSQRVLGENPEVYFDIQASNPFTDSALSEALSSVSKLRKLLNSRSEFVKFFNEAKRALETES